MKFDKPIPTSRLRFASPTNTVAEVEVSRLEWSEFVKRLAGVEQLSINEKKGSEPNDGKDKVWRTLLGIELFGTDYYRHLAILELGNFTIFEAKTLMEL